MNGILFAIVQILAMPWRIGITDSRCNSECAVAALISLIIQLRILIFLGLCSNNVIVLYNYTIFRQDKI